MTNAPKTVLAIHDLPGFGRAALSVIVPVLSALGVQAVALPTAVLSTHTGGLGAPARLADPAYGPAALAHYHRLGVKFDCIYSGYLADAAQAKLVQQAFALWPRAFKVVDPVLGDGGRRYSGLGADMVPAMYDLCSHADLIVTKKNKTALLLGDPLPGVGSAEQAAAQAARLTRIAPQVVVTGVAGLGGGRYIGCVGASRGGEGYAVKPPLQPRMFHGTGDIFAAVVTGGLMRGMTLEQAASLAVEFVLACIAATARDPQAGWYGVEFEKALPLLCERVRGLPEN